MSLVRRVLSRVTSQFPERLVKRVLRESTVLGGLAGQIPQGFENGIHLDFANSFHYIKSPGNDPTIAPFTTLFTFTGGNQSMYRGANGLLVASATNTPRIEYDVNGKCLGLLIEGARTNLCLQSADQGTSWTQAGMLTFGSGSVLNSNATLDPAGGNAADLLTPNTGSTPHSTQQTYTSTATSWTISFFYKPNGYTKVAIREVNVTAAQAVFTCTGEGSVSDLNAATATIQSVGNGWYRCAMVYTGTAAVHNPRIHIIDGTYVSGSVAAHNYAGDGVSGGFIWGVQYEAGSFPSSYIPTTTASVARAADTAVRTLGAEFNATVGTVLDETLPLSVGQASNVYRWHIDDNTTNERIAGYLATNADGKLFVVDGGATQVDLGTDDMTAATSNKIAAAWAVNNFTQVRNGGTVATDAAGTLPTVTTVRLGYQAGGTAQLFGHIRRLDYWPERKPNSELQRLTT